ncbi:MAG TPA: efflux RND transporter periplasmic adaptor subunit [Verrucomicrobiae bacterium]|nr:efflux RND transporter periplasmic adaptor subunit [Verrucomicrobiae bacterium]
MWIVILLVFLAGFWLVLRHHDPPAAAGKSSRGGFGPVTIASATAKKGDIGNYLDSIGTVTPVYTSSITSQVNGIIVGVHYREGQAVKKGDPLIDINPDPYRATLVQAQGTLERDQNILAQARMDLERYKDAWARKAIPKQTLDDQEKIVLQNEGTVRLDQGMVQYDQVQLDFCHITSPIDGRVGLRLVDPGNVVQSTAAQSNSNSTLVVVTQIQPITVIFTIAQEKLGEVQDRLRQGGKLAVDAYDSFGTKKIATGTFLTLDNQIDTTTGTVKARASFVNKDASLFPNEFVNVKLLVNTIKNATIIPSAAIQHNGKTAFVYVVQNDTAHMKVIQTGVSDSGSTQVTGINPGDEVATSSFDKLQDNSKVSISKTPLPTSGSDAP